MPSKAAGLDLFVNPLSTPSPSPGLACSELLLGARMEADPLKLGGGGVGSGVPIGAGNAAGDACPISKYESPFSGDGSGAMIGPGDGTSATGT